ncbi:hypothetical protein LTR15_010109 [Elasticomyces elasticus]|nr:hypothetical protein LTR15_010109 [Elasticomyces elasticus]
MGFGHLTFPQAKAIDICFDLIMGRGGQAVLVWLCYPLFRRSLTRSMETGTVPAPLFSALVFDKVSLVSMSKIGAPFASFVSRTRSGTGAERLSSSWRFVFLFLAFAYLVVFPTWMSSVTGYQSREFAYVTRPTDSSLVPAKGWFIPPAILADGSRVGLGNDFPLESAFPSAASAEDADPLEYSSTVVLQYYALLACYNDTLEAPWLSSEIASAAESARTSSAVNTENSTFVYYPTGGFPQGTCSFTLPLNATSVSRNVGSSVRLGGQSYDMESPVLTVLPNLYDTRGSYQYYAFGNLTLTRDYIEKNISCEPIKTYLWGFSSILLFIFSILTVLFCAILLALQQDAFRHGQADRYNHIPTNAYRDALDLAEELREQLGDDVQRMPADELKRLVERDGVGISIDTKGMVPARSVFSQAMKLQEQGRGRKDEDSSALLQQQQPGKESWSPGLQAHGLPEEANIEMQRLGTTRAP